MTHSADFLPHLLAVVDDLDPVVPAPDLRARLVEAASAACQTQGLSPTPEQVQGAVDRRLSEATAIEKLPSGRGALPQQEAAPFNYGWNRPRSRQERIDRWTRLNRFPWGLLRRDSGGNNPYFEFALAMVCLIGGGLTSAAAHGLGMEPLHAIMVGAVCLVPMGLGICWFSSWLETSHDGLIDVVLTPATRTRLAGNPVARRHIQQCLTSDLPLLLRKDFHVAMELILNHEKSEEMREKKERIESQRADMITAFLTPEPEHDLSVNAAPVDCQMTVDK